MWPFGVPKDLVWDLACPDTGTCSECHRKTRIFWWRHNAWQVGPGHSWAAQTGASRGQWFPPSWPFHISACHPDLPLAARSRVMSQSRRQVEAAVQNQREAFQARDRSYRSCASTSSMLMSDISLGKVCARDKRSREDLIRCHAWGGRSCGRKEYVGRSERHGKGGMWRVSTWWQRAAWWNLWCWLVLQSRSVQSCSSSAQLEIWPSCPVYRGFGALKAAGASASGRNLCSVAGNRVCNVLMGRNQGNWSYW